uniref:ATP-dependent DNA helicase RecG n=1 Tax=Candidatus Kentrum eta TaxID=2126337 RepID=A0A450UGI6_9GAMM|nr:MAG: ATP-dependent DNA helicase RecG [Candidatus Kentron sp. H]VFJ91643.1 MAG: ATP-dependent DNA helicase RecG [Candidatus Kentron sp. H]VFJ98214.1 MAG: ATP-dependent DNA helicase RecG [Candidatus Kentron sp. H]
MICPHHRAPGVIFIGVDDAGTPTDLPITDALLLALSDIRSDGNILPLPALTVEKRHLAGRDVAVILVRPVDSPPVRYKGLVWIRVGPRRALASEQEERTLAERRRSHDTFPDIRPVYEAALDDLDRQSIRDTYLPRVMDTETLAANNRDFEMQLASLRLVHPGMAPGIPRVPTVLGLLVAGYRPTAYLPMAWLSFIRFAGETVTDPIITSHELRSPIPRLVSQVDELIHLRVMTRVDITSAATELRQPDYPIPAIQQIARNAIMHRVYEGTNSPVRIYWYADRIEMISPGGSYGIVTPENFGEPGINDYRNPHLAEAMHNLGYVQRFGVGIRIAQEALRRNGNPPLAFRVEPHAVMATIHKKRE